MAKESLITNDVWDSEIIPNGANAVGCNGSIRRNVTPKGICKDEKRDMNQKFLCKENE